MLNSDSVLSPNERVMVAIVAIIIHIFFAIFLFFPIWERPVPAPEPAGITLISFGNVTTPTEIPTPSESESESEFTPSVVENETEVKTEEAVTEPIEEVKEVVTTKKPDIQTTKNENTVSVPETEKYKQEEKEKKEEKPIKKEEKKDTETKEKVEQKKEETKTQNTTPVEENKNNDNSTHSNEKGDNNTKDKQGNSDNPEDTGKVGVEGETEVAIYGWRWITKPEPNDVLNEQGTIVFNITIDKNGNVTQVSLKSKSNTIGIATYSAYKSAIEKTKFERTISNPITGPSVGTITFHIKVGN